MSAWRCTKKWTKPSLAASRYARTTRSGRVVLIRARRSKRIRLSPTCPDNRGSSVMISAVIGGSGFIGSAVVRRLVSEEQKVTVFDNFTRGIPKNLPVGVRTIEVDLRGGDIDLKCFDHVYGFAARVA